MTDIKTNDVSQHGRISRILLLGASGQLGRGLSRLYGRRNDVTLIEAHRNHRETSQRLDITDVEAICSAIAELKPDVVINAAACANVDKCEVEPNETERANVEGAAAVALACERQRAWCVHFSTDYVFNGENGPYRSTDPVAPLNAYGRQKARAEQEVLERCSNAIVLRVSQVYDGPAHPVGFVKRLLEADEKGETLVVSRSLFCTPVHVADIQQRIDQLLGSGTRGLFHVAGPDRVSRFEALALAKKALGLSRVRLQPIDKTPEQRAPRPALAGLVDDPTGPDAAAPRSIEMHLSGQANRID